jgi:hypothetical protein
VGEARPGLKSGPFDAGEHPPRRGTRQCALGASLSTAADPC